HPRRWSRRARTLEIRGGLRGSRRREGRQGPYGSFARGSVAGRKRVGKPPPIPRLENVPPWLFGGPPAPSAAARSVLARRRARGLRGTSPNRPPETPVSRGSRTSWDGPVGR